MPDHPSLASVAPRTLHINYLPGSHSIVPSSTPSTPPVIDITIAATATTSPPPRAAATVTTGTCLRLAAWASLSPQPQPVSVKYGSTEERTTLYDNCRTRQQLAQLPRTAAPARHRPLHLDAYEAVQALLSRQPRVTPSMPGPPCTGTTASSGSHSPAHKSSDSDCCGSELWWL